MVSAVALMLINGATLVVVNVSVKNIISVRCQTDRELWGVPAIFVLCRCLTGVGL